MNRFFSSAALALLFSFSGLSAAAPLADEAPVWRYTVKPGDNLIGIAERHFLDPQRWPAVQKLNRVADPKRLQPGSVLRIPADFLRHAPGEAALANVQGTVRWRAASGEWQAAAEGQKLAAGAQVETAADASAVLIFADGNRLALAPASQLALDTLSLYADGLMADTRLRLQRGQTDVRVDPERRGNRNMTIQTPSAQAVVRGTRFRVGATEETTREETLDGEVGVAAAGHTVAVTAGLGTVARAGEAPMRPVPLLAAPDVSALPTRFERLPLRFPLPQQAGAVSWQGEVAQDRAFERILLSRPATGPALTFADLPNGDYALRLRAVDAHGLQGQDAVHAFTVFARPFSPGLNAPGDGATVREAAARFNWSEVVDIARYRVQVAASPDFAAPLHDVFSETASWQTPRELPTGKLHWRAASIDAQSGQGPWSPPAAFTYTPAPVPADLGRAALEINDEAIALRLPPPPEGLFYEAALSTDKTMKTPLAEARSDEGILALSRPSPGVYYLGVRYVDRGDGTPGPFSVQKIEIPHSRLWLLLLLLPLAL